MEILKGTTGEVKFAVPADLGNATYRAFKNGEPIGSTHNAVIADGIAKATVPYAAVAEEGAVEIVLSFTYEANPYTFTKNVEVVTPYLDSWEMKEIYPEADDDELVRVESAVRHIINAHTGQSFGFTRGKTLLVEGHGETALRLPERLLNLSGLSTLSSNLDTRAFVIVSDGWYLKKSWAAEISHINSDSAYWGDYSDGVFDNNIYSDPDGDGRPPIVGPLGSRPGGVISAPGTSGNPTKWADDYRFKITGDWGYISVPQAVKEAARLLVNDYACSEIAYRDRYLESIKASDWRLQFNSGAWDHTGNVRADQLLSEFVLLDWAVI